MKIGFNLLLWTGHVVDEHIPLLGKLKEIGYDGVEIPLFGGDVRHYEYLGRVLRDHGLGCTAVTVIPDQERNCLSEHAHHRQNAVGYLKWAVDSCQAMGAETLLGPYHQPLGIFTGGGATEDEKSRAAEVHREIAEYARQANLQLAIEYLNRFECYFLNTMKDAADYVRRVNHPNFGTMYDTFHANIEEKDPVGIIKPNIDVIKHVHISENDRGTPGKGHVPWKPTFRALREAGYNGWMVIEAFGRALPALAAATRVWRDFFASPEEVYTEGYKFIVSGWREAGEPAKSAAASPVKKSAGKSKAPMKKKPAAKPVKKSKPAKAAKPAKAMKGGKKKGKR